MNRSELDRKPIPPIKIIILGPIACGKTSIIRRYSKGYFHASYKTTIGVDFCRKMAVFPKTHTEVELALWDLAGDDRFGAMTSIYYRHAIAAIIVFDLTRPETVKKAMKWYDDFVDRFSEDEGVPHIIFFANKVDEVNRHDEINEKNFKMLAEHCNENVVAYMKTSAKDDMGIEEGMALLLGRIEECVDPSALLTEEAPRLVISHDEASCCT